MRPVLAFLLFISMGFLAQAQVDLETDQGFFSPGKNPYEEDDLDRVHRQQQNPNFGNQIKSNDVLIKDELGSTSPGDMSRAEAEEIDKRIVSENKRRQQAIFKTLAANSTIVKNCINQNNKSFQGTKITIVWLIDQQGKVLKAEIKDSDFNLSEVQQCVRSAALSLDFSAAAIQQYKKSLVEYTYRVHLKPAVRPFQKVTPKLAPNETLNSGPKKRTKK